MARIIADHGRQRIQTPDGVRDLFIYEMDCGCEIRVAEHVFLSGSRSSGVNLRDRLTSIAAAHDCEVVVHHAPERSRREVRRRRETIDTYQIRHGEGTLSRWFAEWSSMLPTTPTTPEQAVREAAERLQGLQVSGVVVDEMIGFKAQEPVKVPEKKSDPPRPKDRFELIEID